MNNIFKILSVFVLCVIVASCSKSTTDPVPLRDYTEQYITDSTAISEYIDTHYLTYDSNYNVTFDTLLPTSGHLSIRHEQVAYELDDTIVVDNDVNYKVYFIKFNEGDTNVGKRPTPVDSVHVAYRGVKLDGVQFDSASNPVWFTLQDVIKGWAGIIPNFHTGTYSTAPGPNPITYSNFGAGVMFLPSGLAYYSGTTGTIDAYSPLIFTFKLFELQYRDHDRDGILSKDEVPSDAALLYNPAKYDSDGDGYANMYDIDDDGDHFTTISELLRYTDANGKKYYYKFNGAAVDDPLTPFDDTQGIPSRSGSPGSYTYDYTTPNRIRKHLDPSWTNLN